MPKLFPWIPVWFSSLSLCLAQAKRVWNSAVGLHSKLLGSTHIAKIIACTLVPCCHNAGNVWASPVFFNPWSEHGLRFFIFSFFFPLKHLNSVCTIGSTGASTPFQKPKCGNGYKSFLCHVYICCHSQSVLTSDSWRKTVAISECHYSFVERNGRENSNSVNKGWGF